MRIRWTSRSLRALTNIYDHIAADNMSAANLLRDQVVEFVENKLVAHPMMGRPGRVAGTRESIIHQNYIIVYRVVGEVIEILTVRHAAQQWPKQF
jgi:toxin ParE1/3/4